MIRVALGFAAGILLMIGLAFWLTRPERNGDEIDRVHWSREGWTFYGSYPDRHVRLVGCW